MILDALKNCNKSFKFYFGALDLYKFIRFLKRIASYVFAQRKKTLTSSEA